MDALPRKNILANIDDTVQRRGWADMPHAFATQVFTSDSEIKRFANSRNYVFRGRLSGGCLLFARKQRDS
jgi:hypothetical protein